MAWSESSLWMCPNCGTSNVEGTRYCERCNRPLVPPPPTMPAGSSPPPVMAAPAPPPPPRRQTRGRRRGIPRSTALILLLVVVVVVIASLAVVDRLDPSVFSPARSSPPTPGPPNATNYTVTVVKIVYSIPTCWNNTSKPGAKIAGGSTFQTQLTLTNSGTKTCVVNAASVTTNGFSLVQSNVPLNVPPAQSGTLHLTIRVPNLDAQQTLGIFLTVSVLG